MTGHRAERLGFASGVCVGLSLLLFVARSGVHGRGAARSAGAASSAIAPGGVAASTVHTDACGCPAPLSICAEPCTACICAELELWVPVDEAARRCARACEVKGQ